MKAYAGRMAGFFFLLCILCIPFWLVGPQRAFTSFVFGIPVHKLGILITGKPIVADFSSDTVSLLLLATLLFVAAGLFAFLLKSRAALFTHLVGTTIVYYLALVLLKYGLDKIFCRQFYTPAPNILFCPFGNLDKDILYWSTIGVSPAYSVATGGIEALAALFLLYRRTRFTGLLIAIISLLHIVLINFAFDISVKCFSTLLLAMALYVAAPQLRALLRFLAGSERETLPAQTSVAAMLPRGAAAGLKFFAIGIILLFGFLPQFQHVPQPRLAGAYNVEKYEVNGVAQNNGIFPIRRFFIHPSFYLVFQAADDAMRDYYFTENSGQKLITIIDFYGRQQKISYQSANGVLILLFENGVKITGRALPWQDMPALQNNFHLTVESVQ